MIHAGTRRIPITEDVADCFKAILEDREKPRVERMVDGYRDYRNPSITEITIPSEIHSLDEQAYDIS